MEMNFETNSLKQLRVFEIRILVYFSHGLCTEIDNFSELQDTETLTRTSD